MQKTNIEWVINHDGSRGFTSNPIKGKCPHFATNKCGSYCYAEKIRNRFKQPRELSFHPGEFNKIIARKKPSTIFIGSAFDIFAEEVPSEWILKIYEVTRMAEQHKFIFLTKNPSRYYSLPKPYPANVWLGASTPDANSCSTFCNTLKILKNNGAQTFVSAEPLLEPISEYIDFDAIDGIIVGALTGHKNALLQMAHMEVSAIKHNLIASRSDATLFVKENTGCSVCIDKQTPWHE